MARIYGSSGDERGGGIEIPDAPQSSSGSGDAAYYGGQPTQSVAQPDYSAMRDLITQRLQAQQFQGGGNPYASLMASMASRAQPQGDPYAALRASMASRQPAPAWGGYGGGGGGGGGIGINPDTGKPYANGWEELARAQAQLDADPYAQYFGNKGPMSGSVTDMGWMAGLQPWQGGASGALTGTGINTSGVIGGGGSAHADPAKWGYGTASPLALWNEVRQTNPGLFERLGGEGAMAAGLAAGVGPSGSPASGFGGSPGGGGGSVSGGGGGGGRGGGGNVGGGYGTNSMGSNTSGDQLGYAPTSPGSTFGQGAAGYDNYNGYGVMGSFSPSSNYSGYSPSNSPSYGNYGGDTYGYSPGETVAQGGSIGPGGYGGAFGGGQSGYGFQGNAPAGFGGGLGQPGFGNTPNSTLGIAPGSPNATIGSAADAYGNQTYGTVAGTYGDAFSGGVSPGWGGFGGFGAPGENPGIGDEGEGESY